MLVINPMNDFGNIKYENAMLSTLYAEKTTDSKDWRVLFWAHNTQSNLIYLVWSIWPH